MQAWQERYRYGDVIDWLSDVRHLNTPVDRRLSLTKNNFFNVKQHCHHQLPATALGIKLNLVPDTSMSAAQSSDSSKVEYSVLETIYNVRIAPERRVISQALVQLGHSNGGFFCRPRLTMWSLERQAGTPKIAGPA